MTLQQYLKKLNTELTQLKKRKTNTVPDFIKNPILYYHQKNILSKALDKSPEDLKMDQYAIRELSRTIRLFHVFYSLYKGNDLKTIESKNHQGNDLLSYRNRRDMLQTIKDICYSYELFSQKKIEKDLINKIESLFMNE